MTRVKVSAAHALKAFKTLPMVQVAKPTKIPVTDGDGREIGKRDGFATSETSCRAEHVLSAAQYEDRMVIVTIDGKRHEARGEFDAEKPAGKKDEK